MRKFETASFASTLAALLKGGVPLLDALGTVQGIMGNRLMSRAIGQVQVRVREGKGMARPLGESGLFPPLALNMIAVGEETGKLEGMLGEVAELLRSRSQTNDKEINCTNRAGADFGDGTRHRCGCSLDAAGDI